MSNRVFEHKFFTLIRPFLAFAESPKFFTKPVSWLYYVFAAVNLLSPIAALVYLIRASFWRGGTESIIGVCVFWIALAVAAFFSFQIWWNSRKEADVPKLTSDVVIDVFADLVYTSFRANSVFVAISGTVFGLVTLIFSNIDLLPYWSPTIGIGIAIVSLIGGYVGVLLSKLVRLIFQKVAQVIVYVIVRVAKFAWHVIVQLFEFIFICVQSLVDLLVNGWRVIAALVAKLGKFLNAFANDSKKIEPAKITYNS
ncbi:MAG: hypothetical protein LBV52_05285 [Spirochaetaceae bacterium]|jgi:hypothetical protein|nr:hypothetical protein [Spirochaetaceae bacterium]